MPLNSVEQSIVTSIPLAVVRRQVAASDLSRVIPAECGAVWQFLRGHNIRGGRHVAICWDDSIRLEVGVELSEPVPAGGEVVRSATPEGTVVSVAHFGSYGQLRTAHAAIHAWCAANNRKLAGPSWEIYGHWEEEWNSNPSAIRTDVFYLLQPE